MIMAKNVSIATPSHWLSKESQSSSIFSTFNHYVVPNGVDSKVYNTVDKDSARAKLGLPSDKKIVLFVSDSLKTSRKGFAVLMDALHQLKARGEYLLCMIGSGETEHIAAELATHSLGYIHNEEAISEAYSAADIFVIPSLADNLPNTVLESLMCGTPVVGFPVGGIVDMIQHGKNGLLCSEVSSTSLAESLQLAFSGNFTFDSAEIRKDAIKRYDIRMQVRNYADLYRKISKHD
jgi:glycosyltransferase involved in cell wall biosynthesis